MAYPVIGRIIPLLLFTSVILSMICTSLDNFKNLMLRQVHKIMS